ncbi:MAG: HD domain-containing phosphohydrolase [Thermodesulfobacteriota bacterium]
MAGEISSHRPTVSYTDKLRSLLEIGKSLSAERDLDKLLHIILLEVTRVMEAERSSILLVDKERGELWSRIAQGLEIKEIRIPLDKGIAGHVATTGETLNIPEAYEDPRFNQEVDISTGFRTRSVLCVPMANRDGDVIGVIQVLNKTDGTFGADDEDLLLAFAGQAAIAVENALLYEQIQNLFESFIRASIYAIESRDPATSGHSSRVAIMTVGLAECANGIETGQLADIHMTPEMLKELRYASLLHDFGKIGVRESVLLKANKLYEHELDNILLRFKLIRRTAEAEYLRKKIKVLQSGPDGDPGLLRRLDEELKSSLEDVDNNLNFILESNKPSVMPEGNFEMLESIAGLTWLDPEGNPMPYITPYELDNLSIKKGSLNPQERLDIESHVTKTVEFLEKIPWTKDIKDLIQIAGGHHEKLDGSGYPHGIKAAAIPYQTRMMTIADIYDALTAMDRAYKKALSTERALDILGYEAKDGKLDRELLDVFIEAKIYKLTDKGGA